MLLRLQKQKNYPASNKHRKKVPKRLQITERMFLRPQIKVRKSRRDDRPQAGGEAKRNPCYVPRLRRSAEGTTESSLPPFPGLVLPHTRSRGFAPACGLLAPFGALLEHTNQKACQITAPIQHPPCAILQMFE